MPRANPPVKHMPTAPTPGPPQRACSAAARARSQLMIGLVLPWASTVNSRLMHARAKEERVYPTVAARPSSPNRWGITAVNPASATVGPNRRPRG